MAIPLAALTALAQFAPMLLKYLGVGKNSVPDKVAEVAASVAREVTGTESVTDAIAVLTGNTQLQWEYKIQMAGHEHRMDELYLQDTKDARARDTEFVKAGMINWRAHSMYIMAWVVVVVAFVMVWHSQELDDFVKATVSLILGRFLGYLDQIYNFEFGSTKSSRQKDDTIASLSNRGER